MSQNRVLVSGLVAGVLSLALVAGCGKRGPLYLPESNAPAPAAEQPEPESSAPATGE
jgi:predicted small lipoprotein YifL